MGKKAANAQPKESAKAEKAAPAKVAAKVQPAPAKAAAAPESTAVKKGKVISKPVVETPGFLSKLRPERRCIFFFAFVAFCVITCAAYDSCAVKGKRRDCGFPGITPGRCRTAACFLKGGGSVGKKTVKVKREDGEKLGLVLAKKSKDNYLVEEVKPGAVQKHNDAQPAGSLDIILPGTPVLKVDGSTGATMTKELDKTKGKTVELEVRKNRVPSFLMWIENKDGKPNWAEKLLTSAGSQHFAATWADLMKIGFPCWLISGYPLASLPTYATISALVSFYMSRCCHNEQVSGGEPHCYKSRRESMGVVLTEVWERTQALAGKVAKDPRGYLEWAFKPDKTAYSFWF